MSLIQLVLNGNGYLNISGDITSSGYIQLTTDPDALSYIQRVGITNSSIQTNIANFVFGLKDLNLWDNTINVYLLNSGYNATTGRTVYSFKSGYDGYIPNLDQTIWTSTGIYLKSGFSTPTSYYSWDCSGKGVIIHKAFAEVLNGNSTIVMLGKTTTDTFGKWWDQCDRSAGQRAIWHNPNAYYNANEFVIGSGDFYTAYTSYPRLSANQQYNIISYSNTFYPSSYNLYSGSGFLTIYKDSNLITNTTLTPVLMPRLCVDGLMNIGGTNYPCDQYSGFIGGFYDNGFNNIKQGLKNDAYIAFAAVFSRVLSHAEHSGLNTLILNTVSQNISLG
jgi:hypothetical protein